MSGCVIKRGTRWTVIVSITDPATGKRKRKYHSGYKTRKEAESACRRLVTAVEDRTYVEPSKMTVRVYFEQWLRDWAPTTSSPKTLEAYGTILRRVIGELGERPMQQIRGGDLNKLFLDLRERKLSPRSIKHTYVLIRRIFRHALKQGDVKADPTGTIDAPRTPHKEAAALRHEEIPVMLDGLRGSVLYPIAVVALGTGMRRGELCALRWQDVDLDGARIEVRRSLEETKAGLRFKEPKSARGRRGISLAPSVVASLLEHRKAQLEFRMKLGQGKPPDGALVFTTFEGQP
jgi:integrase